VMKSEMQDLLSSSTSICLTADAWSGSRNRRSFLGVTGHILMSDDLKTKSYVLTCRLFTGSHTYYRIAKLLSRILKDSSCKSYMLRYRQWQ